MKTKAPLPIVTGATRLYGIIGDPIEQVKSPEVLTARFRDAGVNALLVPMQVKAETFDETIRGLKALANLHGLIATIPYKVRAAAAVDKLWPTGKRVGAINAMRREPDGRWAGDMFDGKGCVTGMRSNGIDPKGLRVMLLGAGGAGSAIADALAEAGVRSITLFDQDRPKASQLADRLMRAHPETECRAGEPTVDGQDVLINATPIGMSPKDGVPAHFPRLDPKLFVVDIVVKADETPLLACARAAGCRTMAGRTMVTSQADLIMRFFGVG